MGSFSGVLPYYHTHFIERFLWVSCKRVLPAVNIVCATL